MNGEERSCKGTTDTRRSSCTRSSSTADKEGQEDTTTRSTPCHAAAEESPWIEEVIAIIADISSCVSQASLSDNLTSRDVNASCAYFNIETLEARRVCVKVSVQGFSIVGNKFDDKSAEREEEDEEENDDEGLPATVYYETPYALLQSMSPSYVQKFSAQLCERLKNLADQVS